MISRFAAVLSIAVTLACLPIPVIGSGLDAMHNGDMIADMKENKAMAASLRKPPAPPVDAAQPDKFETATFALG